MTNADYLNLFTKKDMEVAFVEGRRAERGAYKNFDEWFFQDDMSDVYCDAIITKEDLGSTDVLPVQYMDILIYNIDRALGWGETRQPAVVVNELGIKYNDVKYSLPNREFCFFVDDVPNNLPPYITHLQTPKA